MLTENMRESDLDSNLKSTFNQLITVGFNLSGLSPSSLTSSVKGGGGVLGKGCRMLDYAVS